MKATHKLRDRSGTEWLLCCNGEKHWFNILSDGGVCNGWEGPLSGPVETVYADITKYELVKINTFKGNK